MKKISLIILASISLPLILLSSSITISPDLLKTEKIGKFNKKITVKEPERDYYVPFKKISDWGSRDSYVIGGLSAGDFDNDGDFDVAAGTYAGSYPAKEAYNYIFSNNNRQLEEVPSWVSKEEIFTTDQFFADFDRDGRLDLLSLNGGMSSDPNMIFFNRDYKIEKSPSWISKERFSGIFGAVGDINGDSFLDFIAGNLVYVAGSPGAPITGYISNGKAIEETPSWKSSYLMQNLGLALADYDNDGLYLKTEKFSGDGAKKIIYLSDIPVRRIRSVLINGIELSYTDYLCDQKNGWITFKDTPPAGERNIQVDYTVSTDLDLAVVPFIGKVKIHHNSGKKLNEEAEYEIGDKEQSSKFLEFVDIDNDGDLDLFVGGSSSPMMIFLNLHGRLEDTPSWYSKDESPSLQDAVFADIDKDGDMDLISAHFASNKGVVRIYLNRRHTLDTVPDWTVDWNGNNSGTSVTIADINLDAKPDIIVGYAANKMEYYLNILP